MMKRGITDSPTRAKVTSPADAIMARARSSPGASDAKSYLLGDDDRKLLDPKSILEDMFATPYDTRCVCSAAKCGASYASASIPTTCIRCGREFFARAMQVLIEFDSRLVRKGRHVGDEPVDPDSAGDSAATSDGATCEAATRLLESSIGKLGLTGFLQELMMVSAKTQDIPGVMKRLTLFTGQYLQVRAHVFQNVAETYVHDHGQSFISVGLLGEYVNRTWKIEDGIGDHDAVASATPSSASGHQAGEVAASGAGCDPAAAGCAPAAGGEGASASSSASRSHFAFHREPGGEITALGKRAGKLVVLDSTPHGKGKWRLVHRTEFHTIEPKTKLVVTLTFRDMKRKPEPVTIMSPTEAIHAPTHPVVELDAGSNGQDTMRGFCLALLADAATERKEAKPDGSHKPST